MSTYKDERGFVWAVPGQPATYNLPVTTSVMQEAHALVHGDRAADYGDAGEEAKRIAAGWSVIFGVEVDPHHTALALAWLKITRQLNKPKRDNLVDLAGYAGVAEKITASLGS